MRTACFQKRVIEAWRSACHELFRKRSVNRRVYEVNQAMANTKSDIADELDTLRKMVIDLTEDLRSETISKNTLKYQYEQALLRGMTALNIENLNIQQTTFDAERELTHTSKQLLYSPEKPEQLSPTKY